MDVLVNNAGRGMRFASARFLVEPSRFWETDPGTWRTIIETNVNGPFLMSRAVVPGMVRRGWGRIIEGFVVGSDIAQVVVLPGFRRGGRDGGKIIERFLAARAQVGIDT